MDLISLLPDSVANQIAAGEVIQRPASVIKELVENAVDAGAKTINVIVVDAGRTSIQVIDDGCGMSPTDARLAFERHATSKIKQADDLFALHTMGFRGEALASIAAVAQVELQTRRAENEIGTQISIAGSKVLDQQPVGCPVGCNFQVKNLFYNVPARRKFLKSNATELNNILTAYERIALVYPDLHFTFHHNGAELLNLRPGSLRQRITDVFGKQYGQDLLPVEADTVMCRVTGFVAKPEAARKKGGQDYFFVNGRYMKHPYFHKAVMTAYERLIPEGMQPPYFLYFEINPADIDVNIHPTKTEIKFENEQAIWQLLVAVVRDALGKFIEIPSIDFDTVGKPDIPLFDPSTTTPHAPKVSYNPAYNPFETNKEYKGVGGSRKEWEVNTKVPSNWDSLYAGLYDDSADQPASGGDISESGVSTSYSFGEADLLLPTTSDSFLEKSPTHYQYKGKYIMTAVKSGLMVIDQHRASVRILFDRYQNQGDRSLDSLGAPSDQGPVPLIPPSQRLLFPETLQLAPSDAVLMDQILPELSSLGFDLSPLGGSTFAINGIPAGLEGLNPLALLQQIIADVADHDAQSGTASQSLGLSVTQSLHLSLARAAAIPYGQVLSNDEMDSLVNTLFTSSNVNYTPDGKPILVILPQSDIDGLFASKR
ncbi:MAG: DNA mismatch repair endonuclease MutL [Prevotella sp.]|nr:DNA mismatch repair endonuclease MutL [Prevotella sp.]